MKYVLLVLLCGCDAHNDLMMIKSDKAECITFKKDYDEVGVINPTNTIKSKIEECKKLGAW